MPRHPDTHSCLLKAGAQPHTCTVPETSAKMDRCFLLCIPGSLEFPLPSPVQLKGCSSFNWWLVASRKSLHDGDSVKEIFYLFLFPLPFHPAFPCRRQAWIQVPQGS